MSVSNVTSAPIDFSDVLGRDPPRVATPGELAQVGGGRLAERGPQHPGRRLGHVADRGQPQPAQRLGRLLPHAPQRVDRQRVEELEHPVARDDQEAVGLGAGRAELGDELGRRHPDRAGQALLLGRSAGGSARRSARAGRAAAGRRPTSRNASSLDSGSTSGVTSRKIAMTARDAARDRRAVDRQEHRVRAQPPGARGRHRAAHAVLPRLVAGGAHHAARTRAADHHRLAAQLGPLAHLDRGEERVHVDVQDRAAGVVGVGAEARITAARHQPGCDPHLERLDRPTDISAPRHQQRDLHLHGGVGAVVREQHRLDRVLGVRRRRPRSRRGRSRPRRRPAARWRSGTGPNQPAEIASARVVTHAASPSTAVQAATTSSTAPGRVCR